LLSARDNSVVVLFVSTSVLGDACDLTSRIKRDSERTLASKLGLIGKLTHASVRTWRVFASALFLASSSRNRGEDVPTAQKDAMT